MSSENVLVPKMRKISQSGGGNVIRILPELNEYVKKGDLIEQSYTVEGKKLIIIAVKS